MPGVILAERGVTVDVWRKLWEVATGEGEGPARIEVEPDDLGSVVLVWPDGSRGAYYWHDGAWLPFGEVNAAPGDVAARDSL